MNAKDIKKILDALAGVRDEYKEGGNFWAHFYALDARRTVNKVARRTGVDTCDVSIVLACVDADYTSQMYRDVWAVFVKRKRVVTAMPGSLRMICEETGWHEVVRFGDATTQYDVYDLVDADKNDDIEDVWNTFFDERRFELADDYAEKLNGVL